MDKMRDPVCRDGSVCLGVERSISGRGWRLKPVDHRAVLALAQRHALPEPLARVLSARGVGLEEVDTFLDPKLRHHLPNPDRLKDMDRGADRLATAVVDGEPIAVFADYDVDGATSSAVLRRFLAAAGRSSRLYVPDRLSEGYGPSAAAFRRLKSEGIRLVVTVDCGINADPAMDAARALGLDVIVVDHHRAAANLPPAVAVINPNRLDDDSGLGHLAAVGVTFLLAVATNRCLRRGGWYRKGRDEPDLLQLLDLVALGTVCDMVPLIGLNRAFVSQGLKIFARRQNAGLTALADVSGLRAAPRANDLGFVLGPRINAGGRIGEANVGGRLLATNDASEAVHLAQTLDQLNTRRQTIEQGVLTEALATVTEQEGGEPTLLVWASGAGWHPGVIGIVASRLVERFHLPAFVLSRDGPVATGSARSIPGFDVGAVLHAALAEGLVLKGGGHAMAGGFSLPVDRSAALKAFLSDRLQRMPRAERTRPWLELDGLVTAGGASTELLAALEAAGPYGIGNPEPRFALAGVRVVSAGVMGDAHVRCTLTDGSGERVNAVAFRAAGSPLGQAITDHGGRALHVAGRLSGNNRYGGVRLVMDDAAFLTP